MAHSLRSNPVRSPRMVHPLTSMPKAGIAGISGREFGMATRSTSSVGQASPRGLRGEADESDPELSDGGSCGGSDTLCLRRSNPIPETAHRRGRITKNTIAVQREPSGGYGVFDIKKEALPLLEPNQSQELGTLCHGISLLQDNQSQELGSLGHDGFIHSIRGSPSYVNTEFIAQTGISRFRRGFRKSRVSSGVGSMKALCNA